MRVASSALGYAAARCAAWLPPAVHPPAQTFGFTLQPNGAWLDKYGVGVWRELAVPAVEVVASMLRDSAPGSAVRRTPRAEGSRVAAVPGSPGRLLRGRPDTPGRGPGRCADCAAVTEGGRTLCDRCEPLRREESVQNLTVSGPAALARLRATGHDPAHGGEVEGKRAATQQAHRAAAATWEGGPADPAQWERLQPALATVPLSQLRRVTGYSLRHCGRFRAGEVVPHPRVWAALELLTGG